MRVMAAWTRVTKQCLWRLVMRSAGISVAGLDEIDSSTTDPRQLLLDLLAEKGPENFTPYFIAYMEGMRHTLPSQTYRDVRDWVFTTMPHVIPSYKTLLSMLLSKLACCVLDAVWRDG